MLQRQSQVETWPCIGRLLRNVPFFPEAKTLEGESVHSALTFKLQRHTLEDSHQRIKVWNRTLPSRNVGDYLGEDYGGY